MIAEEYFRDRIAHLEGLLRDAPPIIDSESPRADFLPKYERWLGKVNVSLRRIPDAPYSFWLGKDHG